MQAPSARHAGGGWRFAWRGRRGNSFDPGGSRRHRSISTNLAALKQVEAFGCIIVLRKEQTERATRPIIELRVVGGEDSHHQLLESTV